jgi:replication-associated recombination protein RarA
MDPLILTGPPGCGKSYWIQKYAEQTQKQLFVCPCRKDRTLRDGRQKLHVWARRTEPAILWLEGADDLTPEAQAFLRRILETHASDVLFILECRDPGRLQEPIRSRCRVKKMLSPTWSDLETFLLRSFPTSCPQEIKTYLLSSEYSYRRAIQCATLQLLHSDTWRNLLVHRKKEQETIQGLLQELPEHQLMSYVKEGYHPERLIRSLMPHDRLLMDYGACTEASGSLWAFLGYAFYLLRTTTGREEE